MKDVFCGFSYLKKRGVLYTILFGLFALACDKEVDKSQNGLDGKWNLMSYECCDLPREEFNISDIVWHFDVSKGEVMIQNRVQIDNASQYSFTDNGTYAIEIADGQIIIDYNDRQREYYYSISNDAIELSRSPESDGPRLMFCQ